MQHTIESSVEIHTHAHMHIRLLILRSEIRCEEHEWSVQELRRMHCRASERIQRESHRAHPTPLHTVWPCEGDGLPGLKSQMTDEGV